MTPIPTYDGHSSFREQRRAFNDWWEKAFVEWLLKEHNNIIAAAARAVQMDRKHLLELAQKHGLREAKPRLTRRMPNG